MTKNCSNCFWCRIAFNTKYIYKCKMGKHLLFVGRNSENYMNKPKLHGYGCKYWSEIKEKGENRNELL